MRQTTAEDKDDLLQFILPAAANVFSIHIYTSRQFSGSFFMFYCSSCIGISYLPVMLVASLWWSYSKAPTVRSSHGVGTSLSKASGPLTTYTHACFAQSVAQSVSSGHLNGPHMHSSLRTDLFQFSGPLFSLFSLSCQAVNTCRTPGKDGHTKIWTPNPREAFNATGVKP